MLLLAAGAMAISPAAGLAKPGQGGGHATSVGRSATMSHPTTHGNQGSMNNATRLGGSTTTSQPTTHTSQGSTHGVGWDHMNGPTTTGQPGVECEDVRPGRSATAPGSAFNEEGKAGTRYAGEQPQNSRNTASVSQYDVACLNQPH